MENLFQLQPNDNLGKMYFRLQDLTTIEVYSLGDFNM
jgi:hypothetical protein